MQSSDSQKSTTCSNPQLIGHCLFGPTLLTNSYQPRKQKQGIDFPFSNQGVGQEGGLVRGGGVGRDRQCYNIVVKIFFGRKIVFFFHKNAAPGEVGPGGGRSRGQGRGGEGGGQGGGMEEGDIASSK